MNRYEKFMTRVANGETIIIDGGTGTEIENRGAQVTKSAWSSSFALKHPEIVRQVHQDYIEAGAELIIANTFATSRFVLHDGGTEELFEPLNRRGVEIALEARENSGRPDTLVAGSLTYLRHTSQLPPIAELEAMMAEQAQIMATAGADLIILEMMVGIDYTLACLRAARTTGLPVWVGLSICPRPSDGVTGLFRQERLKDALTALEAENVPMVFLMHSLVEHIDAGIEVIQEHWSGPYGVYAHSGVWEEPHWNFNDVITPQGYCDYATKWVENGVQLIGGCCGISVEHMKTVKSALIS